MDHFYSGLRQAGKDLKIELPPDMIYRGGDPLKIRRSFEKIENEADFDKVSRIILVALSTAIFGTKATRTGRLTKSGNFGTAAAKLAGSSLLALQKFSGDASYTVNAIGASIPEVTMIIASGGATGPQPPMFQLYLTKELKKSLRTSFDQLIGQQALQREMAGPAASARESAIRGQDASNIGAQENPLYG